MFSKLSQQTLFVTFNFDIQSSTILPPCPQGNALSVDGRPCCSPVGPGEASFRNGLLYEEWFPANRILQATGTQNPKASTVHSKAVSIFCCCSRKETVSWALFQVLFCPLLILQNNDENCGVLWNYCLCHLHPFTILCFSGGKSWILFSSNHEIIPTKWGKTKKWVRGWWLEPRQYVAFYLNICCKYCVIQFCFSLCIFPPLP